MKWTKGKVLSLVTLIKMNKTTAGKMDHGGLARGWRRKRVPYGQDRGLVEETETQTQQRRGIIFSLNVQRVLVVDSLLLALPGQKKTKLFGRHRPPKKFRKQKSNPVISQIDRGEEGEQQANLESKRKATEAAGNFSKIARRNKPEVVPNGGLPNQ